LDARTAADKAVKAVRCMISDIGLGQGLAKVGLKEESLPALSKNALNDACLITNPRDAGEEDIMEIFLRSM